MAISIAAKYFAGFSALAVHELFVKIRKAPGSTHATTRARHHRGLALALSSSPGAEVLGTSTAPDLSSHEAQERTIANGSRYRARYAETGEIGLRFAPGTYPLNVCWTFTRRMIMDEKRIARVFGLTVGGLFAISLILSAITI